MKFTKIIIAALIVFSFPSLAFPLVRLKSVTQSGQGKQGTIKVEFNSTYNFKKANINIMEDRVEVTMPEAFVIPVKRVYKPSSDSSSVIKMEVNQIPGNSVKLSVFFRVPMDSVKESAKLSGSSNSVMLNYTVVPTATEKAQELADNSKQETEPVTASVTENKKQVAVSPSIVKDENSKSFLDEKKESKKEPSGGLGMAIARMLGALLVVIGLFLAGVVLFKKYISGGFSLASKNKKMDLPIKMLTTYSIAPGKTLYLVDVMGEILLLSSGKDGMHLVSKINAENNHSETNFSEIVEEKINIEADNSESDIHTPIQSSDIKTKLKERLRSIKGL